MITLMTIDEVLEEIQALPVGEKLSDSAIESIIEHYIDPDSTDLADLSKIYNKQDPFYINASDYDKLILDALTDSL